MRRNKKYAAILYKIEYFSLHFFWRSNKYCTANTRTWVVRSTHTHTHSISSNSNFLFLCIIRTRTSFQIWQKKTHISTCVVHVRHRLCNAFIEKSQQTFGHNQLNFVYQTHIVPAVSYNNCDGVLFRCRCCCCCLKCNVAYRHVHCTYSYSTSRAIAIGMKTKQNSKRMKKSYMDTDKQMHRMKEKYNGKCCLVRNQA